MVLAASRAFVSDSMYPSSIDETVENILAFKRSAENCPGTFEFTMAEQDNLDFECHVHFELLS